MRVERPERMTIRELVEVYNGYLPVRPLKTWKGRKRDLIARIALAERLTSPWGVTRGVTRGVTVYGPDGRVVSRRLNQSTRRWASLTPRSQGDRKVR